MDRNTFAPNITIQGNASLSARRAWIEIRWRTRGTTLWASLSARRAWIEIPPPGRWYRTSPSLSARRAWIEMCKCGKPSCLLSVALRKESVDRNDKDRVGRRDDRWSLSARRAWIEMSKKLNRTPPLAVALRKESVDRNVFCS